MFGKPRRGVRKELEQEGTRASAVVLAIAKHGIAIQMNGNVAGAEAALKTRLRVEPTDGTPPFEVEREFRYSQFAVPDVGNRVTVLYDPDDHDHIMLDPTAPIMSGNTINITTGMPPAGQAGAGDLNALLAQLGVAPAAAAPVDPIDRLAKLGALKQQGLLTEDEFEAQKAKILREM